MEKRSFLQLIKSEFISLTKNQALLSTGFTLILFVILIGSIYGSGTLNQIPTLVLDLDQTSTSEIITKQFMDNEKFTVTRVYDYPSLLNDLNNGKATVGVIIPGDFARGIKSQKGSEILFMIDGTNYIVGNMAYARASEILQTINGGIALQTMEGKGFLPHEAAKLVQSVALQKKVLYNPTYNYSYYLSYGLFGAGIFSLLMSSISSTLSNQSRIYSFTGKETLIKVIVYGLFASIVTGVAYLLGANIFKLPLNGNLVYFFGLCLIYGFLISTFALILLSIAQDEVRIYQLSAFFAMPLFFVSGFTWPLQSIPEILKPLYYLCPLTPFLNGTRAILVMGVNFNVVSKYMLWQVGLSAIYLPLAVLLYKKSREKIDS